jgi:hypothetical protein
MVKIEGGIEESSLEYLPDDGDFDDCNGVTTEEGGRQVVLRVVRELEL